MTVIVEQGQSLKDIAIQKCGDASAFLDIARLNNISATDIPNPGTALELPEQVNAEIANYFNVQGLVPATVQDIKSLSQGGIGIWQIALDFIVTQ